VHRSEADALSTRFPDGTIVLHIGPHKTGTTSLQAAFHANREALGRQGVIYGGRGPKAGDAVRAVLGMRGPAGTVPSIREWRDLVDESRRATRGRFVVSNEFLSEASPEAIRQIADDLDPARVQVVATLRPLDRILPSQWQQFVQAGATKPFDAWLDQALRASDSATSRVWIRHRHDLLLARWAAVVGPQRVTAIVLDEHDPQWVFRRVEELVGLRSESLTNATGMRNRSLTWPEIEAVRALNLACRADGLDRRQHYWLIERGACESMKERPPRADEQTVGLPAEAAERVLGIARTIVAGIQATGVHVVGDLDSLARPPRSRPAGSVAPGCIDPDVSAALSMGILESLDMIKGRGGAWAATPTLPGVPTARIIGAIGRRPAHLARAGARAALGKVLGNRAP